MNAKPCINSIEYLLQNPDRTAVFRTAIPSSVRNWDVWRGTALLGSFQTWSEAIAHATTYTKQNRLISHKPN